MVKTKKFPKKSTLLDRDLFRDKYKETKDILYAVKALNSLLKRGLISSKINNQGDFFKCDIDKIKWPIAALNEYFQVNYQKKWRKFQVGCVANLLVEAGYSVNKTKEFLSKWFKCSNTYVRESYYDIKPSLNATFGDLLIDYESINKLIKDSGKVPNGYDGWVEALILQLERYAPIYVNRDTVGTNEVP